MLSDTIKNKITRRDGASITFALLLFLVCSVICSVVLTAATAASGRFSRLAKNDQRYYAVTSAAGLLEQMLLEEPASIVQVTTSSTTTRYSGGIAESPVDNYDAVRKTYLLSGTGEFTREDLTETVQVEGVGAIGMSHIRDSISNDAAYRYFTGQTIPEVTGGDPRIFTLSSDIAATLSQEDDPLQCTIEEELTADGALIFTISNAEGDPYTVEITFRPDEKTTTSRTSEEGEREEISESDGKISYQVITTQTVTTTTRITWKRAGMRTVPKSE